MPRLALLAIPLLVLVFAGCGDEAARGVVITGNGKMGANNARNQHENAQDVLRIAIEDDLGKGWGVQVTIDEMPIWVEDLNLPAGGWGSDGTWRWEKITAAVVLTPPAGQTLSEAKCIDIEEGSRKHLIQKIVKKNAANLAFSLKVTEPAAAVVTVAPVPQTAGQRTYVVQPGDTLADLSLAFYGDAQHWRLIAEANPAGVKPGQTVVIPALPAAPAPAPATP